MPHVLRNDLNKITHVTVSDIWMSHLPRDDQKRYPVSLLAMFTSQILRVDHKRISCVIVYVNVKSHQSWPLQDTRAVYKKKLIILSWFCAMLNYWVFFPFRKESNVFSVDLGINQIRTQRCIDARIKSFPFYFRLIYRE